MPTGQVKIWQSARTLCANECVPSGMWRNPTAFRQPLQAVTMARDPEIPNTDQIAFAIAPRR
jgi:hypothetical protein